MALCLKEEPGQFRQDICKFTALVYVVKNLRQEPQTCLSDTSYQCQGGERKKKRGEASRFFLTSFLLFYCLQEALHPDRT